MAISPSLIQDATLYSRSILLVLKPITVSNNPANCGPREEFAMINEIITQKIKMIPPDVSDCVNFLKLFRFMRFAILQKYKYYTIMAKKLALFEESKYSLSIC